MEREKHSAVELDERTSLLVQLLNIVLRGTRQDMATFKAVVDQVFNSVVSVLSIFVDFDRLDPMTKGLLLSYLSQDIIISRLTCEESGRCGEGWLRLSPRTLAMISRALLRGARVGQPLSQRVFGGVRTETF
ncbi:MAG: hypothetical protein QXM08_00420 [Thermofilaceae archaeon]